MYELIKKTTLTGIGVASVTKDKIEEIAKELIEKGKMSEGEGKKFVEELMTKSEEAKADMQQQIEKVVNEAIAKLNLAKSSEIEELKKEIIALKEQLAEKL